MKAQIMTFRSMFNRRVLSLAAAAWCCGAISLPATSPVGRDPAPQEFLQLLELLGNGEASVENLGDVLGPIVRERFGKKYQISIILTEAITMGALRRDAVIAALEREGCRLDTHAEAGPCGLIVDAIRSLDETKASKHAAPTVSQKRPMKLAEARVSLLNAEKEGTATLVTRQNYARALVETKESPLESALELFSIVTPTQVGASEDQAVVMAMSSIGAVNDGDRQPNLTLFRSAVGAVFQERIEGAMGKQEIVAQVRALPEELIRRAREIDQAYSRSLLDTSGEPTRCVIEAWRNDPKPANQWLAWKIQLICQGW